MRAIFYNIKAGRIPVLHILLGGIYGGLYRISRGDTKGIVMGVIWILSGGFFIVGWVFDLIAIIKNEELDFLSK